MKNWQTTVSGIGTAVFSFLTVLSALPYSIGDLATAIPANIKQNVFLVCGGATVALKIWNAFAAADASQLKQEGINIPTGNVSVPAPTPQSGIKSTTTVGAIAILATCLGMFGCSTIQSLRGNSMVQTLESNLGQLVYTEAVDALSSYGSTEKLNYGSMIADAMRTLEGTNQIVNPTAVATAITNGGTPSQIAQKLAPIVAQAASVLVQQGASTTQAGEVSANALNKAAVSQ